MTHKSLRYKVTLIQYEPLQETDGEMTQHVPMPEMPDNKQEQATTTYADPEVPEAVGAGVRPQEAQAGKWTVLAIVAVGVFMATLDTSIVNISLPSIAHYFNVPLGGAVGWVIISYLVATAGILLTAGRLADMVGHKTIWVVGLTIFTAGSALCGFSPTLEFLIVARAIQGVGGALTMAVAPAMLISAFPPQERGRALGLNAINVALGVSVGPTLGGFITANLSWHWIFYVNIPVGIIGVLATFRFLKGSTHRNPGRFDPLGALLLAIGLAAITAGLSFGQDLGWTSLPLVSLLVVAVLALVALPFVEARVSNPIIDFALFRNRVFFSANISLVLSMLSLFAVSFMLPFYFEELRAFPNELAGLLLTPLPITLAIVAPFSGSLADRIGSRWLAAGGLTISCIGLVLISQLDAHSSLWDIIWRLIFTGVGQAIFQSPNSSALMGAVPRNQQGIASGFLATARIMGQSLSVALASAIFSGLGGASAGLILAERKAGLNPSQLITLQETFIGSFRVTFLVCACIACIGIFTSLVRGREIRSH